MHLIPSNLGKKLPYIALEFYTGTEGMRECVLTEECPQVRTIIIYVKDKTLYRSFILTDSKRHIHRQYCLNNASEVLAAKSCWRHFQDVESEKKSREAKAEEDKPASSHKRAHKEKKED